MTTSLTLVFSLTAALACDVNQACLPAVVDPCVCGTGYFTATQPTYVAVSPVTSIAYSPIATFSSMPLPVENASTSVENRPTVTPVAGPTGAPTVVPSDSPAANPDAPTDENTAFYPFGDQTSDTPPSLLSDPLPSFALSGPPGSIADGFLIPTSTITGGGPRGFPPTGVSGGGGTIFDPADIVPPTGVGGGSNVPEPNALAIWGVLSAVGYAFRRRVRAIKVID